MLLHHRNLRIPIYAQTPHRPQALLALIIVLQPPHRRPPCHQLRLVTAKSPPSCEDFRADLIPRSRYESEMSIFAAQAGLVGLRVRLRL